MRLALCVVGCGGFARTFAEAMQPLSGEIDLFFASRDARRAADYASAFDGLDSFGSYEAAAADPRVEAMYLCTPHYLHLEHVAMAASAGKHILVEKPIAPTLKEARAIIVAAETAGVTLMVAENYRFMSGVRRAKTLIDGAVIGDLRMVQLQEEAPFQPEQWRRSRDLNGGGVFIDGGIHKVDILLYLAGRPDSVFAAAPPAGIPGLEAEDGLVVVTRHPLNGGKGVVGLINHSWTCATRLQPMWLSVSGTSGSIYYEAGASWLRLDDGRSESKLALDYDHYGLAPMVREFASSIEEGREPEVSGAAGLGDLAVVLRAYESMETGRSVTLD